MARSKLASRPTQAIVDGDDVEAGNPQPLHSLDDDMVGMTVDTGQHIHDFRQADRADRGSIVGIPKKYIDLGLRGLAYQETDDRCGVKDGQAAATFAPRCLAPLGATARTPPRWTTLPRP